MAITEALRTPSVQKLCSFLGSILQSYQAALIEAKNQRSRS
jgi:hypothetical protein